MAVAPPHHQLPETPSYVERDMATAGSLTHKESGYIAELLTLQALELGKNVVVDGSLRDAEWHATYFKKLRESYAGVWLGTLPISVLLSTPDFFDLRLPAKLKFHPDTRCSFQMPTPPCSQMTPLTLSPT